MMGSSDARQVGPSGASCATGLDRLLADTDGLLRSLDAAAVAPFLAEWPASTGAPRALSPSPLPVLRWLPEAGSEAGPVARVVNGLHRMRMQLRWGQTYRAEDFGARFLDRYGWTEMIGQRGPIASDILACGFLLLGPETEYPHHHHAAEEVYVVLSGTASWRRDSAPWLEQQPGAVIHHPSNMPHAMRTGGEALLALYLWKGNDLTQKSVVSGRRTSGLGDNTPRSG